MLEHWAAEGKPDTYESGYLKPVSAEQMMSTPAATGAGRKETAMIVDLPDVHRRRRQSGSLRVRESGGAISLGRVLTLVVVAEHDEPTEGAISAAIDASREHRAA